MTAEEYREVLAVMVELRHCAERLEAVDLSRRRRGYDGLELIWARDNARGVANHLRASSDMWIIER